MAKHQESETEFVRKQTKANVNTVLISIGAPLIVGLVCLIGWFCRGAFQDMKDSFTGVNLKLDKFSESQGQTQLDVNTLKAQLPAISQRLDKVETSQSDMWKRFGNTPSTTRPIERTP